MKKYIQFAKQYWQFSISVLAAVAGLVLNFGGYDTASHWVLGVTAVGLALPMVFDMIQDLRDGTYGVDILAITAIVTAVVMKEYWAAIVIVLMLSGGEALEDFAGNRAKREMTALLDNAPRTAHVIRGRAEVDVPVKQVKTGDKIVIRPGEVVPVDATILEGRASFDESSLTGESVPEEKSIGMELLSGAVSLDGTVTAKALRASADSQYEQIVKLVRSAAASKAPFVRMADRFAIPFTFVSFAIAIGAWAISGEAMRFLQVMVVATPCPLILAAPIAIISGMSRASKAGIIVKNGAALEKIASARSFAFDKTGTLTHGHLVVAKVQAFGAYTNDEVLTAAATLSKSSNHITSLAVVAYAEKHGLKTGKIKQLREIAGSGMTAVLQAKTVFVGRLGFLEENGISVPSTVAKAAAAQTSAAVAIGDTLAGLIFFEDEVRADAKDTITYLHAHGVANTYLVTGDHMATALKVAASVGIDAKHVVADARPVDKLKTVERIAEPPVAFVGDGVNDAPVLVAADVGIALGAKGSTAASESADVVIMKDAISKVADVHAISRRTFKIARQSILTGIGLSVVLMLIFATGKFSPIIGAAVQEIVDVVVIFNALRAHLPDKTHPC